MTSLSGCRYEDNGDAVNNINVMVRSTTKNSIEEFGDPAKFLEENQYLLGKQTFLGRLLRDPLQLYWVRSLIAIQGIARYLGCLK